MKRGPIIHGVLLVLMLGFAYQTWTREKKVAPKTGNFVVWSQPQGSLQALVFETKNRSLRIEKRGSGDDIYYWGIETRTRKSPQRKPVAKDAGADSSDELITSKREFPLGDTGEAMIADFTKLRALRKLGKLDETAKKDYKLEESKEQVTVSFPGNKTRSLVLGGRVHGKANRYVIDTDDDSGYVLAGTILSPLNSGETSLTLKKLHSWDEKSLSRATVQANGKSRELARIEVPGPKGRNGKPRGTRTSWADPATPDKPDQTMANILEHIDRMRPSEYVPDAKTDGMTQLVRVAYKNKLGAEIGYFELWKKPLPKVEDQEDSGAFGADGIPKPGAPLPKTPGAKPAAPGAKPAPGGKPAGGKPPGAKPAPVKKPAAPVKKPAAPVKKPAVKKPAGAKTGYYIVESANIPAEWSGWDQAPGAGSGAAPKPKAKPAAKPAPKPGVKAGAKPAAKPGVKAGPATPAATPGVKPGPTGAPGPRPGAPPKLPPHLRRPRPQKKPTAEYYIRTERTRVLAKVRNPQAERLEEDLKQVFSD